MTAKLTYTRNGVSVSATATINVVVPSLTYFGAQEYPDQLNQFRGCSGLGYGEQGNLSLDSVTYSLGCRQPLQDDGMVWTATAQIPTGDYLTDRTESGLKFVQVVDVFRKWMDKGNTMCYTARPYEQGHAWRLDTVDPFSHPQTHPIQYFSNCCYTLGVAEHDAPGQLVQGPGPSGFVSNDALYVDDHFETYVFYFTTDPAHRDPKVPIFQRAIGLQGSPQSYAALIWSWGGTTWFNYLSTPRTLLYTLQSNTSIGPVNATGVSSLKPMFVNANEIVPQACTDSPQTINPIDGSSYFIDRMYRDFLGRAPDQDGWNFWRSNITSCLFNYECITNKRIDVARAFFYSWEFIDQHPELDSDERGTHEYNRAFVLACYNGFLRREPNDPPDLDCIGFNFWVDKLDSTNPDDSDGKYNEMLKAFLESIEYRNRFVQ